LTTVTFTVARLYKLFAFRFRVIGIWTTLGSAIARASRPNSGRHVRNDITVRAILCERERKAWSLGVKEVDVAAVLYVEAGDGQLGAIRLEISPSAIRWLGSAGTIHVKSLANTR
jgi:hypothetical protein